MAEPSQHEPWEMPTRGSTEPAPSLSSPAAPVPPAWPQQPQSFPQPPAVPGIYPPAYPGYPAYASGPVGRSTGAKVGIAVAAVVGGLVLLSVLAAVAVPLYENQQAKSAASRTTFVLPPTIDGFAQLSGNIDQTVQIETSGLPQGWAAPHAAAYGSGTTVRAVVVGGLHLIPGNHQTEFLNGVLSAVQSQGLTVSDSPAGPLGGKMKCFESSGGRSTTCAFADYGAYGVIAVPGAGSAAHDQILAVRAAVEHRS